ncbi:nuclear transport factor 2 family protein [Amycolatopsis thermophila]|uniref:Ketosteroid isomerase-like protein n=1 Tax=Amycolatopsis thermophila TaxID=206084 RepID=A0ABU0F6R3_9PSEU|nr:nuclear transport factor 2 family protein [Amycolatopsis thermophila]MDQ0382735.1 ketosteroid isomerase-like protein [Amycolatopsis thermophila]
MADNLAVLRRFYELAGAAYEPGAKLPDEIYDLLHPDLVTREPESLPYGGTYHGIEGWRELYAKTAEFWAFDSMKPAEYVCQGDYVVALNRIVGRIRATGKFFDMPLVAVWKFENGRIRSADIIPFDAHAILEGSKS